MRRFALLAVLVACGCRTPKVSLQVKRPPLLELPTVAILAVDDFQPASRGDEAAAEFVQQALIAALNKEGAIQAMDLATAKEKAASQGLKIEAVLRGRVWTDYVHLRGMQEPVVSSDVVWEKTDKGFTYIAETRDKVEYQPYEVVKAFVAVQLNLVQLSGPEEKTIAALAGGRGYRERFGAAGGRVWDLWSGSADAGGAGDRSREGLVRVSAQRAVAEFVKAISPHTETVEVVIAKGGDATAVSLIRSAKYKEAIQRLEPALKGASTPDRAPDFYNLGLAYEALGDPGLLAVAIDFYRKALDLDPENEDYAAGIGRAEALQRDSARMSQASR